MEEKEIILLNIRVFSCLIMSQVSTGKTFTLFWLVFAVFLFCRSIYLVIK